jgi:hypothetical protein
VGQRVALHVREPLRRAPPPLCDGTANVAGRLLRPSSSSSVADATRETARRCRSKRAEPLATKATPRPSVTPPATSEWSAETDPRAPSSLIDTKVVTAQPTNPAQLRIRTTMHLSFVHHRWHEALAHAQPFSSRLSPSFAGPEWRSSHSPSPHLAVGGGYQPHGDKAGAGRVPRPVRVSPLLVVAPGRTETDTGRRGRAPLAAGDAHAPDRPDQPKGRGHDRVVSVE